MRKAYLDRSRDDRQLGMRRATLAAWTVVFALFALVLAVPSMRGGTIDGVPSPGHPIERLVARAVPQDADACLCTTFDKLDSSEAPSLC